MTTLSLIIPCYNEREGIPSLLEAIRDTQRIVGEGYAWDVLFVDDGSTDGTPELLEQACRDYADMRTVRHPRNRGLGAAVRTGFENARGELIATNDADCTFDPRELSQMLKLLADGADVVVGSPYHPQGGVLNVPAHRLFLSRNLSHLYSVLLRAGLHSYTGLFRLYRAEVVKGVTISSDDFIAVAEVLVKALLRGYRVVEHPTKLSARQYGQSKAVIPRIIKGHLKFLSQLLWRRHTLVGPMAVSPSAADRSGVSVVPLTFSMKEARKKVAAIYRAELPESELAALGENFLYQFYFGSLLKDSRYLCYVAYVEGRVAGFAACSTNSRAVCRESAFRHGPFLSWVILKAMASDPRRLRVAGKLLRALLSMKREPCAEISAEAMSTAVSKEYRTAEFHQRSGENLSQRLYLAMARGLLVRGVKKVKGFTMTSNIRVSASLNFLGWKRVGNGACVRGFQSGAVCAWVWDLNRADERFGLTRQAEAKVPQADSAGVGVHD